MRPAELELKVHNLVEAVQRKAPVESSHVELKAKWPDPKKAARALAAHCNASRGDEVLWVIGLDEDNGVIGAAQEELSNWWSQVRAEFDGEHPTLATSAPVAVNGATLVALLFEPTRPPFVVRNSVAGLPGCGPVQFEVPWREGNSTRSARRHDLLRLLVPIVRVPELEGVMHLR